MEEDSERLKEPSYILTNGEPTQPEKDKPVEPGFPFEPQGTEFRDGRRETFAEWLVAPENPLFARVAVNRLWGWHFGKGLQPNPSDFGLLGGRPSHPELLDWLASEFVAKGFSMKAINKLIVMSDTYRMSSVAGTATVLAQDRRNRSRRTRCSGSSRCCAWTPRPYGIRYFPRRRVSIRRSVASRSRLRAKRAAERRGSQAPDNRCESE